MDLDQATLEAADCWFGADRVPNDPAMTTFKRETRYRQALWREKHGWGPGSHPNSKRSMGAGGPRVVASGSKLTKTAADSGTNFLSSEIWAAAQARMEVPQKHETPYRTRLKGDLLSSMPMCFNLFGELGDTAGRAHHTAEILWPEVGPGPVEVLFEWSPERGSGKYTNDRTAFDAALLVGTKGQPRQVIGIETKYHEHAIREPRPSTERLLRHEVQTAHLTKISVDSGRFKQGWEAQVLTTDLRQIWRDHLLLLSMIGPENSSEWSGGTYVLLYPQRNTDFARVARQYADLLVDGDRSFRAMTVEELLDASVVHQPGTAKRFRDRYIW